LLIVLQIKVITLIYGIFFYSTNVVLVVMHACFFTTNVFYGPFTVKNVCWLNKNVVCR